MGNKVALRCVVLDDEFPAVKLLADYVKRTAGLELALGTTSVTEALRQIHHEHIDLILLDIQMPAITGLEMMRMISGTRTGVILTTAYPQYAIDGFEHDAIDYLLKPVTYERFLKAVNKAVTRVRPAHTPVDHIFIKTEYRLQKVPLANILYLEGLRDYIVIFTTDGKILSLERLRNMEAILPEKRFLRIHKSYIINRDHIDYIERGRIIINKERLPIGETYRQIVLSKLGL